MCHKTPARKGRDYERRNSTGASNMRRPGVISNKAFCSTANRDKLFEGCFAGQIQNAFIDSCLKFAHCFSYLWSPDKNNSPTARNKFFEGELCKSRASPGSARNGSSQCDHGIGMVMKSQLLTI